jgi:hypothetical protein
MYSDDTSREGRQESPSGSEKDFCNDRELNVTRYFDRWVNQGADFFYKFPALDL